MARKPKATLQTVTLFSRVGNLGCVRFPEKIRKISGIKRDDVLVATRAGERAIKLEKVHLPKGVPLESVSGLKRVSPCSCDRPAKGCSREESEVVKVGWSYVQLGEDLATRIGFLPQAPIMLIGSPSQIVVSLHEGSGDLDEVGRVVCPP